MRHGLVIGGLRRWFGLRALCAFLALGAAACGSGDGKHRAIECRSDVECEGSELGVCTEAKCVDNRCEREERPDGHRCDDSDPLTGEDACLSGICAGVVKECDDELGPCLKAVYDAEADECVVEPVDDGAPCDDDDACTQVDSCQAGECVGDEPKTCEASDACHVAGECDPKSGACEPRNAPDGEACDDGLTCTSNDACVDGSCQGDTVVCDDGLTCSIDSCDEKSGGCSADMKNCSCLEDNDCDDGNACNGRETCDPSSKLCQAGPPVVCPTSTDVCLQNECIPETGACEPVAVVDGTGCNDGDACTQSDTCQSGVCAGAEPVVCAPLSQCHAAGVCQPLTGACTNPELKAGTTCNDGNACTKVDTCSAGACQGASPTTCSPSDQCHDAGVCNVKTGACSNPAKSNGVTCDDKNPCTSGDACQAGKCTPTAQKTCLASDTCHDAGTCDVTTGACSNPSKADGTSCNDGLSCTGSDACKAGVCKGQAVVCNDEISCTVDTCSEAQGGCAYDSKACACKTSADCNDGNPCNGVETCDVKAGKCLGGTPVDCSSLNDDCNVGVCSATTGACTASPKPAGTACDDKDACTAKSSCQAGVCKGTDRVVCTADQCHDAGTCNPATGVCSTPAKANGTTCNDSNECTQTDTCQGGVCTGGNAKVCTAKSQCYDIGTCEPSTGECSTPPKKNNTACSDGDKCTQTDTCQGGVCVAGTPVVCVSSDQCQASQCDASTGACADSPKKDGTACNDKSVCTQSDTCQKGVCTGASPVTCVALDQCHVAGTCDATNGCSNPSKKDGSTCTDKDACTQTDTCESGKCVGKSPVVCTAIDDCHAAGACDATTGTCSQPLLADGTPCSDGKTCTSSDKCSKGVCGGATVACDDKISCTVDTCKEPTGCNYDPSKCGCAKDADCSDGNACNGVETCDLSTLSCKAGTPVSCSQLDDACNVGVCDRSTGKCSASPVLDGTTCNDGSACTKSDACAAGKCVGSSPVVCRAIDDCHDAGTCAPATGVCSTPAKADGSTCSDGNACTIADTCKSGKCASGAAKTCSALDQCHDVGVCDSTTGQCSNPEKTGSCDDKDACTQTDSCVSGKCVGGNPVKCSASDQCHSVGVCDTKTGACSNPEKVDGSGCTDDDSCTRTDACKAGKCVGSNPVVCPTPPACFAPGVCNPKTAVCSTPFAGAGTACSDANACTSGEVCDGKGTCGGGSNVVCPPATNQCQLNTCNVTLGCTLSDQPANTPCDDGSECTQTDACAKGICRGGDKRANIDGDWADDPGARSVGPTSVDIFTDKSGSAHMTGTYWGAIAFNDKDEPKTATTLALPEKLKVGIYWAVYTELGAVSSVANIGGATGTLSVNHAAGHRNGRFTLIGSFTGSATFGSSTGVNRSVAVRSETIFVANYERTGDLAWLALFTPGAQIPFTATSVAAHDDGSVIATGTIGGFISFVDVSGKPFATSDKQSGVWAARLDPDGFGKWAQVVAATDNVANITAQAVATHPESYTLPDKTVVDDGGASLTGTYSAASKLGAGGEVAVTLSAKEVRAGGDVWFMKLDRNGKLRWGGRVGGTGLDVAGDVVRGSMGGALLLANTLGPEPSANDAKSTQGLRVVSSGAFLQAHVLQLDADGLLASDGLIANAEGVSRGHQLKLDAQGFYAVAGNFTNTTGFYGAVGLGSGPPKNTAQFTIASLYQGPATLFVARVDASSNFGFAAQAGGDTSGMLSMTGWDIVMTAHPSHSITVAGMFNKESYFGDRVPELLQAAAGELGNPFVVHLNSEAEYDYCK